MRKAPRVLRDRGAGLREVALAPVAHRALEDRDLFTQLRGARRLVGGRVALSVALDRDTVARGALGRGRRALARWLARAVGLGRRGDLRRWDLGRWTSGAVSSGAVSSGAVSSGAVSSDGEASGLGSCETLCSVDDPCDSTSPLSSGAG
jgi:hypothetical protein